MMTGDRVCIFKNTNASYILLAVSRVHQKIDEKGREDRVIDQVERFVLEMLCVTDLMNGEAFTAEDRGPSRFFTLV
jgi:hypothetical protein